MNNRVFNFKGDEIEIEEFHPGQFLMEEIKARQIKKKDFAKQIGISTNNLNLIYTGKKDISIQLALRISKAFGVSDELWCNMQSAFDLQKST